MMHENHKLKPCVFFDRDGIVNRFPGEGLYVERVEDFHIQRGFLDALRVVSAKGYVAVIVTNQRGVALGKMTMDEVHAMHERLRKHLATEGLELLDIFVCPHGDNAHPDRKPNPGMLLEAARKHGLDLSRSWMIGDSERDIEAGRRAGCAGTVFVGHKQNTAEHQVPDIEHLAALLVKVLP